MPAAVWMCPDPAGTPGLWPAAVVEHTIRAFSQIGDRVRFAPTTAPTTAAAEERCAEKHRVELDTVLASARRLGRAPCTVATPPSAAPTPAPTEPGSCRLVIAAIPPRDADPAAAVGALPVAGARVVVVLTASTTGRDGVLIDPSGAIIRAAQARGLRYLQHVVAIGESAARVIAGRTDNGADDAVAANGERAETAEVCPRPGVRPHRRVHTDVLVFLAGARP